MVPVSWVLLMILTVLLIGYATGRRQGVRWGRNLGRAESSLTLRQESLRTGICKICDRAYD